jgi:hypothetical protein
MRLAVMLVLCSLAIPSGAWSDCTEPVAKSDISFGLPFICGTTEKGKTESGVDSEDNCSGRCLADSFQSGLSVVLLGNGGVCRAKTGDKCTFDMTGEVTQVVGTEECLAGLDQEEVLKNERFVIAVVGLDPAVVRLVSPSDDKSPLPKEIELSARRLLEPSEPPADAHPAHILSDSPPRILRVKHLALVGFWSKEPAWPTAQGPPILLDNDRIFRLQGWCTDSYVFFSVNYKLHLTYSNSCCSCGWNCRLVYDLSGETPKLVYSNDAFAN